MPTAREAKEMMAMDLDGSGEQEIEAMNHAFQAYEEIETQAMKAYEEAKDQAEKAYREAGGI